jgi:serine/threonine protein kinase
MDKRCVGQVRTARGTRPDLKLIDMDGRMVALKDYRNSAPWFRRIVGPLLIRREAGALRKLDSVDGVPKLCQLIDAYALVMEYVDGVPMRKAPEDAFVPEFYSRLESLIDQMHAAGVAHCDLRTGNNILVDTDGHPHLIDFASCVFRGRGLNPLINWISREFRHADRRAALNLKRRFSPGLLTPDEEAALAKPMPFERPAIFIGKTIRNITRRALTRE